MSGQQHLSKANLFLVGAAKSGTTSLAVLLSTHSDVFMPSIKEPFYFVDGFGMQSPDEYSRLYDKSVRYNLDASTGYLYDPSCPRKIKDYNPNAKILIVLRNPITFVLSYWEFMKANGNENLPFEEAISDEVEKMRSSSEFRQSCEQWSFNYLYRKRALYYSQVKSYLDVFKRQNIKIVLFEDLIKDRTVLKGIYEYLDVEWEDGLSLPKSNSTGEPVAFVKWLRFSPFLAYLKWPFKKFIPLTVRHKIRSVLSRNAMTNRDYQKRILDMDERNALVDFFQEDVKQLTQLLPELDFSTWQDFNGK
jgi:Sulfotransferase domain.